MYRPFANLDQIIKEKNIRVHYPRGYQDWKRRFEQAVRETGSVSEALDKLESPNHPQK